MIRRVDYKEIGLSEDFVFEIKKCPLTYDYYQHTHNFSELVVILDGRAIHVIDDREYPVKAGQVFLINGDMSHGYKDVDGLIYFNVIFKPDQILMLSELKAMPGFQALFFIEPYYRKEQNFSGKLELSSSQLLQVENILGNILNEYEERKEGYRSMVITYLTSLITMLSRFYSSNNSKDFNKVLRIAEAITFIEKNYLNPLTLKQISDIAYLSPRQFVRVFKQNYKTPPLEYVIKLRLECSRDLLSDKSLTISQIALKSGFSDHNYFSRQFKKVFCVTPSVYRNRLN